MKSLASLFLTILSLLARPSWAGDSPLRLKESTGIPLTETPSGCPLEPNLTGDCANLRYYNLCSGYIWVYDFSPRDAVGVRFDDGCISPGHHVERGITYFRNVSPGYNQTIDVFLDADTNNDGCPDYPIFGPTRIDPGLRWNCSELGATCIPVGLPAVILRTVQVSSISPRFATDTGISCDQGSPHSYVYFDHIDGCDPWRTISPTGRDDNLLYWLVMDSGCLTSTQSGSWGRIKGLYR
jgi:hypothetical protein